MNIDFSMIKNKKYPKIGVALIFTRNDNEILLLHRTKDDVWGLVGGKVDYGETFEETAIRESLEEVNLEPTEFEYLGINEVISKDKKKHYITVYYLVKNYIGCLKNNEKNKHNKLGYFKINELPENLFFPLKSALPKIKKCLELNNNKI